MSSQTQVVLYNAVPLLAVAAVYLGVAAAIAPNLWRQRGQTHVLDLAIGLTFPAIAFAAGILGLAVAHERAPLVGHLWLSFAVCLVALIPAFLFLARWGERALVLTGEARAREAERRISIRDRELEAVTAISNELARAQDDEGVARILLPKVQVLLGIEFTALAAVDQDAGEAWGVLALVEDGEADWWREMRLDLRNEPSGIASAVFEAAPVTVYDVSTSRLVSPRLAEAVDARSGAWIPLVSEERVLGVLVLATTSAVRAWTAEEISLAQAMGSEAALALDRVRSATALFEALERERLVARISRRVRSELDVDALMRVATVDTGEALGVARCFIRLGEPGERLRLGAEWHRQGLEDLGERAARLPASNLAARERRTVALADVEQSPELDDDTLGGRQTLLELRTKAVLAVPILVFGRMIGVVAAHHAEPHAWSQAEIDLTEAVAREVGLALHTARLLGENQRRLEQQAALLHAAQVVTSELELEVVFQRLVEEVTKLLRADAADCYLYDRKRQMLRCAAVHGLDPAVVGFEFSAELGLAGEAIRSGRPVSADEYGEAQRVPHDAYNSFARALVAPMIWSGETRGVLGVGMRDATRDFDEADVELLEAFAGLASLALRNAESFEQRASQARIQRGFYRIASVLGEPLSLEATVGAIAQAAAEALGGAAAALLSPSPRGLALAGAHDLPVAVERVLENGMPEGAAALAAAAEDGRVLASSELTVDERFGADLRSLLAGAGIHALLAVPVEASPGDEAALALVLFGEPRSFTDNDLELARQLGRAARGALERGRLFEAERSARALAQQLARTGSQLASELDPSAVLDEVVEQAASLLGADAASVRVLEGDELVLAAAAGTEDPSELRAPASAWPGGDVMQSRAPVTVADTAAAGRPPEGEPLLRAGYGAYLGVPLYGPEGAFHGVLAVYTERPRGWRGEEVEALAALAANASAALSNAELYQRVALERERSVAILANIADGIVAVDRDGRVVLWNAAAALITGIPGEEAIGRPPAQVLQRNLESDQAVPPPNRLVAIPKGDEEIWLSLSEAVMRDPAGGVAGRIFAFRDISSERVVDQMKSDFVSAVSHELRTPLTSIYGFAETLLRRDVAFGESERNTFLGYIASESERLTRIVDTLLNVARVDAGDLQMQLAPTDVGQVVSEVVEAAQAGGANGHRFVVELDGEPLEAEADRDKLRQILDQLIENAVKFSPGGGTVTVAARRRSDAVEVSVADQGVGIPAAHRSRVFTKFFRADPDGPEGTGMGLFIAHGLVNAMGGRIWVDSTEGAGSSFTFELPLARMGA